MKKQIFSILVLAAIIFTACDENSSSSETKIPSQSRMNHLVVVTENEDWTGPVGDAIRNTLASQFLGVVNEEPAFSLNQVQPQNFNGFATKSRNIVVVDKGAESKFNIKKNRYAQPQTIFYVAGSEEEISAHLAANKERIHQIIKNNELSEKIRQIQSSTLSKDKSMETNLGIQMSIPAIYNTVRKEDDFLWIERPTPNGTMNILAYELPKGTIPNDSTQVNRLVEVRDSIGQRYIPGKLEGSYMITENIFAPYVKEDSIDNKSVLEARGRWDLKNGFMAGPFVSYTIDDTANNRQVVIEGFVFAPQKNKRDLLFELEAILRTAKIQ